MATRIATQVPNALTLLRVLLAPLVAVLILTADEDGGRWLTLIVFLLAASTDGVDGWFARRFHVTSRFGAFVDPVADKLLILGAFGSLVLIDALPAVVFLVVAVRELLVTVLRLWLIRTHQIVMSASVWGKAKTTAQIVALAFYLAPGVPTWLAAMSMSAAVALTVWSGIEYIYRAKRLVQTA